MCIRNVIWRIYFIYQLINCSLFKEKILLHYFMQSTMICTVVSICLGNYYYNSSKHWDFTHIFHIAWYDCVAFLESCLAIQCVLLCIFHSVLLHVTGDKYYCSNSWITKENKAFKCIHAYSNTMFVTQKLLFLSDFWICIVGCSWWSFHILVIILQQTQYGWIY